MEGVEQSGIGTKAGTTLWNLWSLQLRGTCGCFSYVGPITSVSLLRYVESLLFQLVASAIGPLLPQLVAPITWNLCRLSWLLPLRRTCIPQLNAFALRKTFVTLVGHPRSVRNTTYLRYGTVVTSAMGPLNRLCYVGSTLSATSPLLRSSLSNRSSSRAHTYFASRQVSPKGTHLLWQHCVYEMKS